MGTAQSDFANPECQTEQVRWASAATGSWCARWPGTELRRRITTTLAGRGRGSGRRPVLPPCRVRSFVRSLERQAAGPVLASPEASCIAPDRGTILGWRSIEDRPGFKLGPETAGLGTPGAPSQTASEGAHAPFCSANSNHTHSDARGDGPCDTSGKRRAYSD